MTLLKLHEPQIVAVKDSLEIFQVIQNIPRRMLDCGKLMDACFRPYNFVSNLTEKDVERRRREARYAYRATQALVESGGSGEMHA